MKKYSAWIIAVVLMTVGLAATPHQASADAMPGDVIITLGEDLSEEQRQQILNEMDSDENTTVIEVSNEEEYEYLGDYVSAAQIGSNAISSSKITLGEAGDGINVETNRITWVSEGMYANALVTAGVEDADIYVTAPVDVSGTAGLTGLLKAYEVEADIDIPEEQKQIANEEMVRTAELGDSVGEEEATELMTRIKEAIAEENVETEEDLRALIERLASELGINLSEEELEGLVSLFNRMQNLDIDWNQVQNQVQHIRDNLDEWLNREETQSFIDSVLAFFSELIDTIAGWFNGQTES